MPSRTTPARAKPVARKFTVPEVWRRIVKKNERQGGKLYDVLVCDHAVLANDNTYRRARACPACRIKVQDYADRLRSSPPDPELRTAPRQRRSGHSRVSGTPGRGRPGAMRATTA